MSESGLDFSKPLPPLKVALEAVQIDHEGRPMVMMRDQEGINDQPIGLSLPGFVIATLLDGRNTLADVQSQFSQSTGTLVTPEEIKGLLGELERAQLLETPALAQKRRQILSDFLGSPVRKAVHVGAGYPSDKLELAAYLGRFFQDPKGPGKGITATPAGEPLQGLIAPHIDFERGGPAYAWAYGALGAAEPPDLIVAVGVGHASPPAPWNPTRKAYETPYGAMAVDEGLYQDFQRALWYDGASEEWVHRTEHSLEFQALWLRYVWRDKTPPWLPILCSSFESWADDRAPSSVPTVEAALSKFGACLRERQAAGQRILILAGIDLAHVGPRFGDDIELNAEVEKKIEAEDRASLEKALALDADGFYLSVIKDDHWRKVCGLSALYTALRLLKELAPGAGSLLTYGQAPDPAGGIVSFTSASYPRGLSKA